VVRLLMPFLLKTFIKRAQNNMNQRYDQQNTYNKKEGEINVSKTPNTKPGQHKEDLGDYVDFEDVKDETLNK